MDTRRLDTDVAGAAAAHQGLLAMLDGRLSAGALDVSQPGRLPGWSIGHVLTHLARNADSMVRVLVAPSGARSSRATRAAKRAETPRSKPARRGPRTSSSPTSGTRSGAWNRRG